MTEQEAVNPADQRRKGIQASVEQAKSDERSERRRSLELRAGFYEKLIALDAGAITVAASVGVAVVGKSSPDIRSVHSILTWLLWIAIFLAISLVCSVVHNSLFIKIAGLEAEQAKAWSNYLGLLNGLSGSEKAAEIVTKILSETLHKRIQDGAMNLHKTEQSVYRCVALGKLATWTFLIACLLALVGLVHLWWITR